MKRATLYAVLLIWAVITLYPMAWMAITGLKTEADAQRNPWSVPTQPEWSNLGEVWQGGDFQRAYGNSIIVAVAAGLLTICLAAPAAFAFARMRFRGRDAVFYIVLLGMMIPVHVTLIPLNQLLQQLGLRRTHLALIAPYVGFALPLSIFILRGFFQRIPPELEEAARIDGCTTWGVFIHVALPSARPALATVIIFNFVTMWNEFVFALTFVRAAQLRTMPLALWRFSDESGLIMSKSCAATTLGVVPLLIVFFIAQKHIIRGLTAGALKQ